MFGLDLSFIWAGIIALSVLMYVILDGFDLGVGILMPFAKDRSDRDLMVNSVAPIWDGNETWLVLGGGGLFAVFPLAYSIVLPALYMPIILMLIALIFRGCAFEFRVQAITLRNFWDKAFFAGSLVAAMMQGIALGALVQGIHVEGRAYAGGWWDWLTPFSLLTGIAVPMGYALLGATWLNLKLEGRMQFRVRELARRCLIGTLVFLGLVSLFTPLQNDVYAARWFTFPAAIYSGIVPFLVALTALRLWAGLKRGEDLSPFLCALALFVLAFIGIGISFYPMIVPPALSISEAAAPDVSLHFLLIGTLVLLPVILIYTGFTYWVFRGKIDPDEGYH